MIRKKLEDPFLLEHLSHLPDDRREIYLLCDGEIRLSAVSATRTINQMKANHETGPLETYILGQGYIAGALLSSEVKGNDRIQLSIECGGPVKGMQIEAWACGAVRGYLMNNPIPLSSPLTSLDTNAIYGPGFLSITKILEGSKTPFTGQIMMEYGHLAQDLALYYQKSEQTPSLFSLSLSFDKEARVWGAGGIMLQAMPECRVEVLEEIQKSASSFSNIGDWVASGNDITEYIENTFSKYGVTHLGHAPIGFSCPCSEKNFSSYLQNLPQKEKDEILSGPMPLKLQCFNCGTEYSYTKSQLLQLFSEEK